MKNITVLKGGWSSEREVSLKSGENVAQILKKLNYNVTEIDIIKDLNFITKSLYASKPDFIFNMLHGTGGEDGVIQGILDVFGVPYNTSNTLSSAICFDKAISKELVKSLGVNVIKSIIINSDDLRSLNNEIIFQYPFVIKASQEGSSVGIYIIKNEKELKELQNKEWKHGKRILVEEYIKGREFTVLVINGKSIGAVEILPQNDFYDYASKYNIGGSKHIADYQLDSNLEQVMLEYAELSYIACANKGMIRVDFIVTDSEVFYLETNTQPGMTSVSLVPDIAKANGISQEVLLDMLINNNYK
ncbi:MAG: D-alanine--D-alanine ligase [Alphaproteobacteria bacterium]|nr:D-alanine--D-alanine ligase [Alphaproteobacteria bacterium]